MKGANQEGGGKAGCLRPGEAEQAPSYYHQPLYFPLQSYRTFSILFPRGADRKQRFHQVQNKLRSGPAGRL